MGKENTNPPEQDPDDIVKEYRDNLGRKSDFDRLEDEVAAYQAQHPEEYGNNTQDSDEKEPEQGSTD